MINVLLRCIAGLAVMGALVVATSSGCTGLRSSLGGCSARDERSAVVLADLPIMSKHHNAAGLVVSAAVGCFRKQIDGATAHLNVWFPSDLDVPGEIRAPTDVYGDRTNLLSRR